MHRVAPSTGSQSSAVNQYTRLFGHARVPVEAAPDKLIVYGRSPASFPNPHFATTFVGTSMPQVYEAFLQTV